MSEEKKKEVKVINVPKRKKPLAKPSYLIRIAMIVCFVICILLLSSPFLSAKLYITKDLEITSSVSEAYREVATQEEVDNAEKELQNALNSLEKIEKTESSQVEVEENTVGLSSANYKWSYKVSQGVDASSLAELIDKARNTNKREYTSESVSVLNKSILNAQKTLCASVLLEQSVLQMAMGGAIGESVGNVKSLGSAISHSLFSFILGGVPLVCFITLCFVSCNNFCGTLSLCRYGCGSFDNNVHNNMCAESCRRICQTAGGLYYKAPRKRARIYRKAPAVCESTDKLQGFCKICGRTRDKA